MQTQISETIVDLSDIKNQTTIDTSTYLKNKFQTLKNSKNHINFGKNITIEERTGNSQIFKSTWQTESERKIV